MADMISLSFKKSKAEQDMYKYVKSKYSPSAYLKELIEKDMNGSKIDSNNDKKKENKTKQEPQKNSVNLSAIKNMGR